MSLFLQQIQDLTIPHRRTHHVDRPIHIFDELIPHLPFGQSVDAVHELREIRRQPPGIDAGLG